MKERPGFICSLLVAGEVNDFGATHCHTTIRYLQFISPVTRGEGVMEGMHEPEARSHLLLSEDDYDPNCLWVIMSNDKINSGIALRSVHYQNLLKV